MKTLTFTIEESKEEVTFHILSGITHQGEGYLLVEDVADSDQEETTVYVLKASAVDGEDLVYDLVDDDQILEVIFPLLEEKMNQEDAMN